MRVPRTLDCRIIYHFTVRDRRRMLSRDSSLLTSCWMTPTTRSLDAPRGHILRCSPLHPTEHTSLQGGDASLPLPPDAPRSSPTDLFRGGLELRGRPVDCSLGASTVTMQPCDPGGRRPAAARSPHALVQQLQKVNSLRK